nr:unnamed protein product [Callosobruchus analis]
MNKKRQKRKNRVWVREWIKKRDQLGALNNLVTELRDQDNMHFENFLRMKKVDIDYILETVIERDYIPFVVIRPENDASKGLYTKLGFKKYFQTVRAILKPKEMANDAQGGGTEDGEATEETPQENRIDNDVNGIAGGENGKIEVDVDEEEKEQNCRED